MLTDDEVLGCEVCRSAVAELGMIPLVDKIICDECASDAHNELIVRARNKMGTDEWHGPKHELSLIVADMSERRVA